MRILDTASLEWKALLCFPTGLHAGEKAGDRLREITRFIRARSVATLSIFFDVPDKDSHEEYAAWSATYDYVPNPVIQIEEPLIGFLIDQLAIGKAPDAGSCEDKTYGS